MVGNTEIKIKYISRMLAIPNVGDFRAQKLSFFYEKTSGCSQKLVVQ
jgi:hypothetical protein